jgi:hypothetical protein
MLLCDLTQFYSPMGGGVRRYLSEKGKYLVAGGDRHLILGSLFFQGAIIYDLIRLLNIWKIILPLLLILGKQWVFLN